ncbi:PIN domain-containing protein [Candidatus Fermentibacteria bacterium]|nr:PIN domain-containing protein [Candidatus Fermentibacteria bacterium]
MVGSGGVDVCAGVFDVCCLNRPFDDQGQPRVRLEAEAVLLIMGRCQAGQWEWIGSEAVTAETLRNPDPVRRERVLELAEHAEEVIRCDGAVLVRAHEIMRLGFSPHDALHIACAEAGNADVFLSTDDSVTASARRTGNLLTVRVRNPLAWIEEVER